MLRAGQTIVCQVTKNPIGAKGARLTQEVSLPGRFAVLVPNSSAFGISKRLGDNERRRLRKIIDEVRPAGPRAHRPDRRRGRRRRTSCAATSMGLLDQWKAIEAEAARATAPGLLYREPDLAVRILREELNGEYRGVMIDDPALYRPGARLRGHGQPGAGRAGGVLRPEAEGQPLFERYHVHEQLHKALDRKVWLPSGGSLIIERTEALTVIDVNTGKNVGKTNLEETVFRNNLEAAEEVARQLRLRDIGGIIVIDFIDMEIRENRDKVAAALRNALARDKTRTQVFDISELGLVEMTRKRISGGPDRVALHGVRGLQRPGDRPRHVDPLNGRSRPAVTRRARSIPVPGAIASPPMYAVIRSGGKQERVAEGQRLRVELLGEPVGAEVQLEPVLLVDGETVLATPGELAGCDGHRPGGGRGARPQDQRHDLQDQDQPAPPMGPPPALHHGGDHLHLRAG